MHRPPRSLPVIALALTAGLACSATAMGHAVVTLGGKTAKAGGSGNLSLKIEHGCSGGLATNRVVAWFSSDWRSIRPTGPAGWTPTLAPPAGGDWTVTWAAVGDPTPFAQPFTLTMRVGWPRNPRIYTVPTLQFCGAAGMAWTDPYTGPADAHHQSPADFPVPRIRVSPR